MNIFYLDSDPARAARYACNRHIVKMPLESAQMLSTVARILLPDDGTNCAGLYKSTHASHPCVKWLLEHEHNWVWLWSYTVWLNAEYRKRYKREHKSFDIANKAACLLQAHVDKAWLSCAEHTPPPQCMPAQYRIPNDPVAAYRAYYKAEKGYFAKWDGRVVPEWW